MTTFNHRDLMDFVHRSPTPFHAVKNVSNMLLQAGFKEVDEFIAEKAKPNQKLFCTRGGSAILAYQSGSVGMLESSGIRLIGAHTDSPCLKVKPNPDKYVKDYHLLAIQPYGGVLLAPWFDRDLSLAGRVVYEGSDKKITSVLVNFENPIGIVPSLAIHLDRSANENKTINAHEHLNVLIGAKTLPNGEQRSLNMMLMQHLESIGKKPEKILDYDLCFYDTQQPQLVGIDEAFLACSRLDNLLSTYLGAKALIDSDASCPSIFISNDHEEVGSQTDVGAKGSLLKSWLDSCFEQSDKKRQVLEKSLMLSVDNAHGVHPNFVNKHDDNLGPILNNGPVIKYDINQAYATNSETAGLLKWLAQKEPKIPMQSFAVRADMRCGSTIGPMTSTSIGIPAVDIGVPTFAMHSIRELAGAADTYSMYDLLVRFCNAQQVELS